MRQAIESSAFEFVVEIDAADHLSFVVLKLIAQPQILVAQLLIFDAKPMHFLMFLAPAAAIA